MPTPIKYPKMPTEVQIGTQLWAIEERNRNKDSALSDDAYGYTLHRDSLIIIDSLATPSRKRQTLLHELMHAVRHTMGSPITPKNDDDSDVWEHFFIGMYEEGLLLIIRDNPKVLDYLLSEE
jgi:Zn-dependent peptidase ImmA (M78 family)